MKGDPSTRRARNVVLLVILMVALPSILLTIIGAAAVENEEVAAKRRLETAYAPVLWDMAKHFNAEIDRILHDSNDALDELVELGQGHQPEEVYIPEEALEALEHLVELQVDDQHVNIRPQHRIDIARIKRMALDRMRRHHRTIAEVEDLKLIPPFIESTPVAVNYFVLAPDGDLLLPRHDREDPRDAIPTVLLENKDGDCEDSGRDEHRCVARYADLLQRINLGSSDSMTDYNEDGCEHYAESAAAKAGTELMRAFRKQPSEMRKIVENANQLVRLLSNPLKPEPPDLSEYLARRVARKLEYMKDVEALRARYMLLTIAERPALLRHISKLSHPRNTEPQVAAYGIEDWRRVVVWKNVNGFVAGFEIVPPAFEPALEAMLRAANPGDVVRPELMCIQAPSFLWTHTKEEKKEHEQRGVADVLLKRTDLAWQMALVLDDPQGVLNLAKSRSTLYFWALILTAGALILGIGYTVKSVIREAQLARLKTDFVSSVSHDLRTPLTSIRMFTETLLLGRADSENEAREFLQVIADETERLSRLTERILDFSRMEAGRKAYQFSEIDISDLIQRSLAACRPMIEEAAFDVTVEIGDDLPAIHADRDAMIEVLINLVSNAIKYSPDEKKIVIRAAREGSRVAISVSDRGIGIPKSEHKKIFEKFYRVECRRTCEVGGSGIGLSLVDHIVSAHQGQVDVASKPGEGSTFTVRLAPSGA